MPEPNPRKAFAEAPTAFEYEAATDPCGNCTVRSFTAYGSAGSQRLQALLAKGSERRVVPARRVLQRPGDVPGEVFSIREGWAFRFHILPDGRRQILSFLLPGDLISLPALIGIPIWFSVQTLTAVRLCPFRTEPLRNLIYGEEALIRRLGTLQAIEQMKLEQMLTDNGRRSAIEAAARLILQFHHRLTLSGEVSDDGFPFYLRQEHLADALGITPVHVSRTLAELKSQGLITLRRGRLQIHHREQMMGIAGLDESYPLFELEKDVVLSVAD